MFHSFLYVYQRVYYMEMGKKHSTSWWYTYPIFSICAAAPFGARLVRVQRATGFQPLPPW